MFQGNKVVSRREEEIRKSRHELRLKTMRSVVNSSPSPSTARVTNAKKVLLMEEKCTEIERENRILYEKILKIRNKTPTFTPAIRSATAKKSLNETFRKQQLQQINQANSELYDRIKRKESSYRLEKFNFERKETEKILSIISEFRQNSNKKKFSSTVSFRRPVKRVENTMESLVHRQGKIVNGKSYLVEVYQAGEVYKLMAYQLETPDQLMLSVGKREVLAICGDQLDFTKLVKRVQIVGSVLGLLLERPVSSLN